MKLLSGSIKFVFMLLVVTLKGIFSTLVWIIHFIDGGEEEDYSSTDHVINYNYRTAELDAVKRPDGLYEDR